MGGTRDGHATDLGPRYPREVWVSVCPCPQWIGLEDSEDPFQLQQAQIWSRFSLLIHQKCLWLGNFYCSGCGVELSIVCKIQGFARLQKARDLFVVYHLLQIMWANKTARRFSFCSQHFKASTFLVKTPRPIITWTPIKVYLAEFTLKFSNLNFSKILAQTPCWALIPDMQLTACVPFSFWI